MRSASRAEATVQSDLDRGKWLNIVGSIREAQGNLVGAENAYAASLEVARKLAAANPGSSESKRGIAVNLDSIGSLRFRQGDLTGAYSAYSEGLADFRQLADADPESVQQQSDVSNLLGRIGTLWLQQQRYEQASKAFQESIAIDRKLAETDKGNVSLQGRTATRMLSMARLKGSGVTWREVATEFEALNAEVKLNSFDLRLLNEVRKRAALETAK